MAVKGDYAYIAGWDADLWIIDVSDPASPVEVGFCETRGLAYDVAVAGRYAYVADGIGLRVIDVSDPASPVEAGYYDTPGEANGVAVAGGYAYIADGGGGLFIVRYKGRG